MTGPLFSQIALTPKTPIKQKHAKSLTNKFAYEWKNIFRELTKFNVSKRDNEYSSSGITLNEFDEICQSFKIRLMRDEMNFIK